MNQKGFTYIALLGIIIVVIVGFAGYFSFRQKSTVSQDALRIQPSGIVTSDYKTTTQPVDQESNLPKEASTSGPLDTAWAVITVLSVKGEIIYVQIEEIRDYNRYPKATYPELKTGDKINTRVYDTASLSSGRADPLGVSMVREEELTTSVPSPKPEVGKKYLADMSYCITDYFGGLSCEYEGWSSALYPY